MKALSCDCFFAWRSKAICFSGALLFGLIVSSGLKAAQTQTFNPVTAFPARVIGPSALNVIVGGGDEGTPILRGFLHIKERTSDRAVFEFDLRGRGYVNLATIDFRLNNLDSPDSSTLSVFAFDGNGVANASDYYRTDFFVSAFPGSTAEIASFSLDVTSTYNQFVAEGRDYLGFVVKNNETQLRYSSRYWINPFPTMTTQVPEPTLAGVAATVMMLLSSCLRRTSF